MSRLWNLGDAHLEHTLEEGALGDTELRNILYTLQLRLKHLENDIRELREAATPDASAGIGNVVHTKE